MIDAIKSQLRDFHHREFDKRLIDRDLSVPLDARKAIAVIGPRRAGKTSYLHTLVRGLDQTVGRKRIAFVSFEDERLQLETAGLQLVVDAYQQLCPDIPSKEVYFFFDEIQEIEGWEKFVRRVLDTVSSHVFLTGSSSKLLGSEIASALRGRTLAYTLMPFSFREYLRYVKIDSEDRDSTRNRNRLAVEFRRFLARGGYPEVIDYDDELFARTLQSYVDIMLYRDIIERRHVSQVHVVKEMARRFIASNAQFFSVHKHYRDLRSRGVRVSKSVLYDLLEHFCEAYYVLPLRKYDASVAKQEQAAKKFYVNDPGYLRAFSYTSSPNAGYALETTVFLELLKLGKATHYFSDQGECDFIVTEGRKIVAAIQVCYELTDRNRAREVRGLRRAMARFRLPNGVIVTDRQEETLEVEDGHIHVVPAWRWILSLSSPATRDSRDGRWTP